MTKATNQELKYVTNELTEDDLKSKAKWFFEHTGKGSLEDFLAYEEASIEDDIRRLRENHVDNVLAIKAFIAKRDEAQRPKEEADYLPTALQTEFKWLLKARNAVGQPFTLEMFVSKRQEEWDRIDGEQLIRSAQIQHIKEAITQRDKGRCSMAGVQS